MTNLRFSLVDDLRRSAARRGSAPAVSWHASGGPSSAISYAELLVLAETAARGLHALGILPGDRIADFCDEGSSVVLAIVTIGCAGAVLVPLDPAAPMLRLRGLIADSRPAIALCSAGSVMARLAAAASDTSGGACDVRAGTSRSGVQASDSAEWDLGVRTVTLESLLELGRSFRGGAVDAVFAAEQWQAGAVVGGDGLSRIVPVAVEAVSGATDTEGQQIPFGDDLARPTLSHVVPVTVETAVSGATATEGILAGDGMSNSDPVAVKPAAGATALGERQRGPIPLGAEPTPLSHIIYTSGSSGSPKGVACPVTALHSYCTAKAAAQSINTASRVLLASAHTWDPCVGDVWSTLSAGGTLCLVSRTALLSSLADSIHATRATHVCATPTLFALMAAELTQGGSAHGGSGSSGGDDLLSPKGHISTPGQRGHSPERRTATGTASRTTTDKGNAVPQRACAGGNGPTAAENAALAQRSRHSTSGADAAPNQDCTQGGIYFDAAVAAAAAEAALLVAGERMAEVGAAAATGTGVSPHGIASSSSRLRRLSSLRVVALGGEQLPRALATKWGALLASVPLEVGPMGEISQGVLLLNTYGVTEATVYQTLSRPLQHTGSSRDQTISRPLHHPSSIQLGASSHTLRDGNSVQEGNRLGDANRIPSSLGDENSTFRDGNRVQEKNRLRDANRIPGSPSLCDGNSTSSLGSRQQDGTRITHSPQDGNSISSSGWPLAGVSIGIAAYFSGDEVVGGEGRLNGAEEGGEGASDTASGDGGGGRVTGEVLISGAQVDGVYYWNRPDLTAER